MINRDAIKLIVILWMTLMVVASQAQNIGINATGSTPNNSAGLDVDFTNKGMLVPRVALTGTADVATIATPATSLLVYNTATAGVAPNNVVPGFYYWSGSSWMRLVSSATATNIDWSTTGNSGTNYSNFIGTTDNVPLKFKVNNVFAGKISDTNLVIGVDAFKNNGIRNTVFGTKAMKQPFASFDNVVIGHEAMLTGWVNNSYNVAIGSSALRGGGEANIAIGYQSLYTGNYSGAIAIGNASSYNGASGIAIGNSAKYNATFDSYGIGIGEAALYKDRGYWNTSIGHSSMYENLTGTNNVALGIESLRDNTTGNSNTALGHLALINSNGSMNTSVGDSSGRTNTLGNLNTYLGYNSRSSFTPAGLTNSTAIGANSYVSASNSLILGNNANVGIGTSAPTEKLEVVGKTKTNQLQVVTGATNGYILTSDATGNGTWQNPGSIFGWGVTGNSGTNSVTNFMGTTDAQDLVFKTDNIERMRMLSTGNVGIGNVASPTAALTINSNITGVMPGVPGMIIGNNGNSFITIGKDASNFLHIAWLDPNYGEIYVPSKPLVLQRSGFGGNVGISTTSPLVKLDLRGINLKNTTAVFNNLFQIGSSDAASPLAIQMGIKTDAVATNRYGAIEVDDAGTKRNLILQSTGGDVGIGTLTPGAKLEVAGQVKITGGTPGVGRVLVSDATGLASWQTLTSSSWDLSGNTGTSAATNFIGSTDANDFVTRTNNIERSRITSAGNFGIGDATPSALFTVGNGDLFQVVSTGHMRNINGTAALPSHSFTGDNDNGIYLSGANEMSLSTAATQRAVITSAGNFGIGDATPAALFTVGNGDLFQVVSTGHMRNINGTAALPSHSFVNDDDNGMYLSTTNELSFSTAATQRMVVSSTGNVGIANATPLNKLDVAGAGTASNGVAGFNEVVAHFKNTNAATHSAISVDALTSQDPVIYLAENGSPYWDIRNDSDGPDKFQIRWQGGSGSNTPRFTIDNAGNVGIGTTAPTQRLHVVGNGLFTGTVTASCGVLACSDIRYKTNVQSILNPLEKINAITGVTYDWLVNEFPEKGFTDQKQIGFIAQELEKILPEMVHTDEDGYKTVDYAKVTPVLVEAMKEQQTQIEDLKTQYESLLKEVLQMKMAMSNSTTEAKK